MPKKSPRESDGKEEKGEDLLVAEYVKIMEGRNKVSNSENWFL